MPKAPHTPIVKLWSEEELYETSIDPLTRRTYQSHLNRMNELELPLDIEGLVMRMRRQDGTKACTLKVTRSAVNWWRSCNGKPPLTPIESARFVTLLRGRRRRMPASKIKGAIDAELVCDLLDWLRDVPECTADHRRNIKIAWGTGLRANQLPRLRRSHFVKDGGRWSLRIEENHTPYKGDRDAPRMQTQHVDDSVQGILDDYLPLLQDTDLVCPAWNTLQVNAWIKMAATECDWDESLAWKGAHQLRHGVAAEIVGRCGKIVGRAVLGHAEPNARHSTIDTYCMTNVERKALYMQIVAKKDLATTP